MTNQEPASILLIDDHPMLRTGVKQLVSMAPDITVVGEASNGEQGIELAESLDPDLILLDLNMPGMDGWQLRRELQRRMPDVELPIAIMTSAKAQSAEALDVVDVLQKPFPLSKLVALVDRYCAT